MVTRVGASPGSLRDDCRVQRYVRKSLELPRHETAHDIRNDAPVNAGLRWYLASSSCFIVPNGIQQVLYPWLVAVFLMESAERVGFAQMATSLPSLLLILFGGVLGDRYDQRRILLTVHVAAAIRRWPWRG